MLLVSPHLWVRVRCRRIHPVCHLPSVGWAVEAFFAGRDLAAGTCRTYRQALGPLVEAVGADRPVTDLCPDRVAAVFEELWAGRAPATWNTRRVAIQAFASWCGERSPHLEAWAEEWRGGDYPPFEGLWSGFENGRRLVPGAGEYGPVEGRVACAGGVGGWPVGGLLLRLLPCPEEDGRGRPGLP